MVRQVCVLKDLYLLHRLSLVPVQHLPFSHTGELLKSSSNTYVLLMLKTKPFGG